MLTRIIKLRFVFHVKRCASPGPRARGVRTAISMMAELIPVSSIQISTPVIHIDFHRRIHSAWSCRWRSLSPSPAFGLQRMMPDEKQTVG